MATTNAIVWQCRDGCRQRGVKVGNIIKAVVRHAGQAVPQKNRDPARSRLHVVEARPLDWEESEEPVLRWVAEVVAYDEQITLGRQPPYEEDHTLDRPDDEVVDALRRLIEHGLVSAGQVVETVGGWHYTRLRVTADGYRVLGEWPPSPTLSANEFLADVLRHLAGSDVSSDEEQGLLRRAAGALARFTGSTITDAALDQLSAGGEEIVE